MISKYYLGLDIGGTKSAVVLASLPENRANEKPVLHDRFVMSTGSAASPRALVDALLQAARRMLTGLGPDQTVVGTGISCGSPLDSRRGLILSPPNLPGWDQIPITEWVRDATGLPAWLLNDADAGALAEWRFGAGRGCQNMVFLTFGTGFGAGLILNGRLYSGIDDGAGEIGHVRISPTGPVGYGKAGSLEGFCSGGGIAQLARLMVLEKTQMGERVAFCDRAGGPEQLSARLVGEAADDGDPLAKEILAVSGRYLGQGLAILLDLLNPERIVIGSIFARSQRWIWPAADEVLKRESLARTYRRCQVLPAQLGEQTGDLAAVSIALEGEKGALPQ